MPGDHMITDHSRVARGVVPIVASAGAAVAGAALQALLGYRFPLITFFPAIMLSGWFGGFWPGVGATAASALLVDYLWLAPLRARNQGTGGDVVALALFGAIGLTISGFCESLHRAAAREHESSTRERMARERAEAGEAALTASEHDLRLALARERAARADAQDANRMKDQFLAMVSHELRTPLNALLGWADMLKRNVVNERRRDRAIDAILANATRQAQIVDDLLDVARILAGKLQLHPTLLNIEDTVRAALEIVQGAADAKGIELTLQAHRPIALLQADGVRIQQVLWNLLSNAIKFTPDHGVVQIRLREVDDVVEIVIEDTGQGIPNELLQVVFEPFRQVDSSTTRAHAGLGLGLSIVRYLVDAHGGTVGATSAGEGRGATFTVRLPIGSGRDLVRSPEPAAHTPSTIYGRLDGMKVLLVDDDADSREVMAAHLEDDGAVVLVAASAQEALDIVQREPIGALFVDVAMPGQDGYTLIRTIRKSPSTSIASIPAAAVTALASPADRDQALHAGFQLHIPKPVSSTVLRIALAELLATRAAAQGPPPAGGTSVAGGSLLGRRSTGEASR
jgi:signal transduction histidine kinase/ActR/RegA family two-component response regulator